MPARCQHPGVALGRPRRTTALDAGRPLAILELLERGGPRSWRLLAIAGVLDRSLPELGAALGRRQDEEEMDPLAALGLPRLLRLQDDPRHTALTRPEWLLLAALILEATDGDETPSVVVARKVVQRLDLGAVAEQSVAGLVADAGLLHGAARRLDGLTVSPRCNWLPISAPSEQARRLYLLTAAGR